MLDGKPVADVEIGIYDARRGIEDQSHEERIATDHNGRFSFAAIRPDRDYWVYTKMDSSRKFFAASMKRVHVGADNSTLDLGDLEMTPTLRVSGRIVTVDGQPPLPGRVFLANDDAWDDQIYETGPDGEFSFFGVTAGCRVRHQLHLRRQAPRLLKERKLLLPRRRPPHRPHRRRHHRPASPRHAPRAPAEPHRPVMGKAPRRSRAVTVLRSYRFLAPVLLSLAALAPAQTAAPEPRDLAVTAVDESGKPLSGVTAYVANSFLPLRPYGPSRDRGLTLHSGDDGVIHFGTLGADRGLLVAVAAPGYGAKPVSISPDHKPANVKLHRRDPAHQDNAIIGRLVNASGQPVPHALLLVTRSMRTKNSWLNGADTGDAMAITDDQGRFALVPDKCIGTWLQVFHEDCPPYEFPDLLPAASEQTLTIPQPATIRARLTDAAKPIAGIELALCEGENGESNPPIARAKTTTDGSVVFPLVPPGRKWLLFATMNPARATTIEQREVEAAAPGETVHLGEISLVPTINLAGFIKAEGAATPPASTIILQRFRTGETLEAAAAPDGTFAFPHIPRGSYTIYIAAKDPTWHISPKNRAYPFDNALFIQGALDSDKPDLTILLTQDKAPPVQRRAETLPMRGIEPHDEK